MPTLHACPETYRGSGVLAQIGRDANFMPGVSFFGFETFRAILFENSGLPTLEEGAILLASASRGPNKCVQVLLSTFARSCACRHCLNIRKLCLRIRANFGNVISVVSVC